MQFTEIEIRVLLTSIARQLRGLYDGSNWVAPNLTDRLGALSQAEAFTVPAGHSASVAHLVLHMAAWRQFVVEKLREHDDFEIDTPAADWPTPQRWPETLATLAATQNGLFAEIEQFDVSRWHQPVPGRKYNFGFLLQGVVHHDFYHYGQIGAAIAAVSRANT